MAHNIELNTETGKHSFLTHRIDAWHRLGENVSDAMTTDDIMKRPNFNFGVDTYPVLNYITGESTKFLQVIREDNNEVLAIVSEDYEVIPYASLLSFMNAIVGKDGYGFETAGILGKGETFFATIGLGSSDLMASGDKHTSYLSGVTGHAGNYALQCKMTKTRIVCQNTLNVALNEKGSVAKIYHKKGANQRVVDASAILNNALMTSKKLDEKLEILAQRELTSENISLIMAELLQIETNKELSNAKAKTLTGILDLYESNDNNAFPQFRGTAYNLLNAITEFTDHYKGNGNVTEKQRAYNSIFGSGGQLKQRGIDLVFEMTKDASLINQPKAYSYPETQSVVADLLGV